MAVHVANIDKLNDENYATWCKKVKSLVITLDLYNTVLRHRPEGDKEAKCLVDDSKTFVAFS